MYMHIYQMAGFTCWGEGEVRAACAILSMRGEKALVKPSNNGGSGVLILIYC